MLRGIGSSYWCCIKNGKSITQEMRNFKMSAPMNVISAFRRLPIVVILGATGTGKSKLAIEIGRKLNGEIISADAMQLYHGLDIITNKVTKDEQRQCTHHMIDYVDPHSFYTVTDFRNKAVPIIDGLLQRDKLPIIVGGTNYYIEALLWNILIGEEKETDTLVWEERPLKKLKIMKRDVDDDSGGKESMCDEGGKESLCDKGGNTTHCSNLDPGTASERLASGDSQEQGLTTGQDGGTDTFSNKETSSAEGGMKEGSNEQRTCLTPSSSKDDPISSCRLVTDDSEIDSHQQVEQKQLSSPGDRISKSKSSNDTEIDSHQKVDRTSKPTPSGPGDLASKTGEERVVQCDEIDIESADNVTLHGLLTRVDPERAKGLHPNDRRKIIRSLQVYEQQGIPHSELLTRQHQLSGASSLSGPLRYPNLCILWLQAETEVLRQRLDDRVDDMIKRGLVEELAEFHTQHNKQRLEAADRKEDQYVNGIFQSIGFKEFHDYLILSDKESTDGVKLLEEGVEKMKIATRQYARRQNKWVRNRFVKRPGLTAPSVYSLDTTDPCRWDEIILQPALNILDHLLQGKTPLMEPVRYEPQTNEEENDKNVTHVCDVCDGKLIVGWNQWQAHIKSRSHAKRKRKFVIRNWEKQQALHKNQGKEEKQEEQTSST